MQHRNKSLILGCKIRSWIRQRSVEVGKPEVLRLRLRANREVISGLVHRK